MRPPPSSRSPRVSGAANVLRGKNETKCFGESSLRGNELGAPVGQTGPGDDKGQGWGR